MDWPAIKNSIRIFVIVMLAYIAVSSCIKSADEWNRKYERHMLYDCVRERGSLAACDHR